MKKLLQLEDWAVFLLSILIFSQLPFAWWVFPALILLPDLGMVGYLVSPKVGAWTYNFIHHRAVAAAAGALGIWLGDPNWLLISVILFGHISMDRALGYGLKHEDSFANTHLGKINFGKQ